MDVTITFTVNGRQRTVTVDPQRPLLDVLREELQLTGTKYGCGEGRCGACTVLIDGKRARSCITPAAERRGQGSPHHRGTCASSRGGEGALHPVQAAFLAEGAFQCGYCTPGMIMTTVALLRETPHPTDEQILAAVNGNLCRCCDYPRILKAVHRAAEARRLKSMTHGKLAGSTDRAAEPADAEASAEAEEHTRRPNSA